MNMFVEFILLSLAYNLHARVTQIWRVHSWHAHVCLQTVVHTSSAYIHPKGLMYVLDPIIGLTSVYRPHTCLQA